MTRAVEGLLLSIEFSQMLMQVLTIVAALLAPILGALIGYWFTRHRRAIRWVTLTPMSMMEIADEVSERLQVTLDGKSINNLTKFAFIVHNCGREPIDGTAIVEPLRWKAPGKIIDARIVNSNPHVNLQLHPSKRSLEIKWELFNQKCRALIEVIADAEMDIESEVVSAQIRGIPKIKHRSIRHVDEREIRKRIKRDASHLPRFVRIASEKSSVWLHRNSTGFSRAYVTISLGLVLTGMTWELLEYSEFYLWVGLVFFGSLSILLYFFPRNPYDALLRNRNSTS